MIGGLAEKCETPAVNHRDGFNKPVSFTKKFRCAFYRESYALASNSKPNATCIYHAFDYPHVHFSTFHFHIQFYGLDN